MSEAVVQQAGQTAFQQMSGLARLAMDAHGGTHEWRCRPSFQSPMLANDLMAKETA